MGKYDGIEFELMQIIRNHFSELEKELDERLKIIEKKIESIEDSIQYFRKRQTEIF